MIRTIKLSARETQIRSRFDQEDTLIIICDGSIADFTVNLPDAQTARQVSLVFIRNDDSANTITISAMSTQSIKGSTTFTSQYDSFTLVSDGENWRSI